MKRIVWVAAVFLLLIMPYVACGCTSDTNAVHGEEAETMDEIDSITFNSSLDNEGFAVTQNSPVIEQIELTPNSKLVVFGEKIKEEIPMYFNSEPPYALLPLTKVLGAVGAEVKWSNDTQAEIIIGGKIYFLNLAAEQWDEILAEGDSKTNCLSPVPGGHIIFQSVGNELFIDSVSVTDVLMSMNVPVTIKVDAWRNTVRIDKK